MERPTSTEVHSTMSRQSGRQTVDQESVSAGEMALDTARGDQQQIMDKAHVTECRDLPVPGCVSDETPSPPCTCSVLQLHSQDVGRWL